MNTTLMCIKTSSVMNSAWPRGQKHTICQSAYFASRTHNDMHTCLAESISCEVCVLSGQETLPHYYEENKLTWGNNHFKRLLCIRFHFETDAMIQWRLLMIMSSLLTNSLRIFFEQGYVMVPMWIDVLKWLLKGYAPDNPIQAFFCDDIGLAFCTWEVWGRLRLCSDTSHWSLILSLSINWSTKTCCATLNHKWLPI